MQNSNKRVIKPIQSFRGVFAILIFLHHFTIGGVPLNDSGNLSVVFFIVLSGVVLMLGYGRPDAPRPSYGRFLKRRMLRIYPVYFITLMIATLVITANRRAGLSWTFLADIFMLQTWIPMKSWFFSGNSPSWFVADYLYFYLLFPLLLGFLRRSFRIFLVCLVAVIVFYFSMLPLIPDEYAEGLIYISPAIRCIDFAIGMAIGFIIVNQKELSRRKRSFVKATIVETVAVTLTAVAYFARNAVPYVCQWVSWWWIPVGLLIYVFSRAPFGEGGVSRLLSFEWMVKFGDLSYSFFLSGFFCIDISRKLVYKSFGDWQAYPGLTLAVALLLCFISALILYNLVEVPLKNLEKTSEKT